MNPNLIFFKSDGIFSPKTQVLVSMASYFFCEIITDLNFVSIFLIEREYP